MKLLSIRKLTVYKEFVSTGYATFVRNFDSTVEQFIMQSFFLQNLYCGLLKIEWNMKHVYAAYIVSCNALIPLHLLKASGKLQTMQMINKLKFC